MSFPILNIKNPQLRKELEDAFIHMVAVQGKIIFVHSGGTATASGKDADHPISTLDVAIGKAIANKDVILILPGHAESIATASAIDIDVAGLKIIGLGEGESRPKITVITSNSASIEFASNNTVFKNIIVIAGKDGLTGPLLLKGSGLDIDIETRDLSDVIEAVTFFLSEETSNYCKIKAKHQGFTTGSGNTSYINLVGADYFRIDLDYFGKANTSVVEFSGTPAINAIITGNIYNQGVTTYNKFVVDTITGSTWSFYGKCGENGVNCSGSQDTPIAATDTSGIAAALSTIDAFHDVPAQDAADNVVMSDVIGNKTDTVAGTSIVSILKQIYAREGSPAGASLAADLAAIKVVVDAISAASITEIAEILSAVDSEIASILTEALKIEPIQVDIGNPSARTNLKTLEAMLGNPDVAAQSIWDALGGAGGLATFPAAAAAANNVSLAEVIRYIQESQIGTLVNAGGTATLGGILGDFANVSAVTRFANIQTEVDKIDDVQTDLGNPSSRTNLKSIEEMLGNPDTAAQSIWDALTGSGGIASFPAAAAAANNVSLAEVIRYIQESQIGTIVNAGGTATIGGILGDFANVSAVTRFGNIQTEVNKIETPSSAVKRLAGRTQIFTKNITSAANAGVVTVGTITTQSCFIKRIVLMSNGATTADLTSAAIKGGASQAVTFISAATAVKASIDAEDEQVAFSGAGVLNATDTIAIDLQGTGATAVDLTVFVEYCSCVDGGYIA